MVEGGITRETIAVLGPGGVGGLLAAALARSGTPVVAVAREETAEALNRAGIAVRSAVLGDFHAHPRALAQLEQPVRALLVATKADGLDEALDRIATPPDLVVPLLNGLEHMETLRARFGAERVAAGKVQVVSDRPRTGEIVHTSSFVRVQVARDQPGREREIDALVTALSDAGIDASVGTSEAQVLWSKLVRLGPMTTTLAAADRPWAGVRDDPVWRERLEASVREAAAIARADGATVDPQAILDEMQAMHDDATTSMQRDIAAGRPPELDAIAGAVVRAGARHGLEAPTLNSMAADIARRTNAPYRPNKPRYRG
jgi:2-dehydropantoate 2-reductase